MRLVLAAVIAAIDIFAFTAAGANATDSVKAKPYASYIPQIHGAFRTRFELDTRDGAGRFNVRNARVTLTENVGRYFTAFAQVDLCDMGKFRVWDAWARINAGSGVSVQLGQFRMPFGADSFLGPANYYFANRSFIGKYLDNYRAVGLQGAWKMTFAPVRLSAGIFNPGTIDSHSAWTHSYSYAARVEVLLADWKFTTGFMSHAPDRVRLTLTNFAARWSRSGFTVDGEYMYRHYAGNAHHATHGWLVFADYAHSLSSEIFNRWSAQARFDGMTALSNGMCDDEGRLHCDQQRRNRITLGGTISHIGPKSLEAHLRLNYEKYFYGRNAATVPAHSGDRLLAELVIVF